MTPQQKRVIDLESIRLATAGIAPTYEEIGAALGIKSRGSVHSLVSRLVDNGRLIRHPNRPRGLALPGHDLSAVPTANLIAELESRGWKRAA